MNFDDFSLHCVQAIHSSSFADGSYGGLACGFVLKNRTQLCLYRWRHSLFSDMKLIPLLHGALDLAILPIGDLFTMGYKEAKSSDYLECRIFWQYISILFLQLPLILNKRSSIFNLMIRI